MVITVPVVRQFRARPIITRTARSRSARRRAVAGLGRRLRYQTNWQTIQIGNKWCGALRLNHHEGQIKTC
jgi:hypothetical protein